METSKLQILKELQEQVVNLFSSAIDKALEEERLFQKQTHEIAIDSIQKLKELLDSKKQAPIVEHIILSQIDSMEKLADKCSKMV